MPLPFKWRRGLLKFLSESPIASKARFVMKIVFVYVRHCCSIYTPREYYAVALTKYSVSFLVCCHSLVFVLFIGKDDEKHRTHRTRPTTRHATKQWNGACRLQRWNVCANMHFIAFLYSRLSEQCHQGGRAQEKGRSARPYRDSLRHQAILLPAQHVNPWLVFYGREQLFAGFRTRC